MLVIVWDYLVRFVNCARRARGRASTLRDRTQVGHGRSYRRGKLSLVPTVPIRSPRDVVSAARSSCVWPVLHAAFARKSDASRAISSGIAAAKEGAVQRQTRYVFFAITLTLALVACGSGSSDVSELGDAGEASALAVPEGWNAQLALPELVDLDPSAKVVEVQLEARVARVEIAEGHSVEAYTYSGSSPGPVIRVKVGDTLRVHFSNQLPEPTTVHWHGLEVPADQDGAGHAGSEIAPGASFEYEFTVPHAGTYWYHPHVNSAAQVWRGLYGALIVEESEPRPLGEELTLLLHDVGLDAHSGELLPAESQGDLGRFFGHEGNTLLVNGHVQPTFRVFSGSTLRLRVINTSISRYYRLALDGHQLLQIAGDSGPIERTQRSDEVLLVPGERSELVVTVQAAVGARLLLRALPYDRFLCGGASDCSEEQPLLNIEVVEGQGRTRSVPEQLTSIAPIDTSGALARELVLEEASSDGHVALAINGHVHGRDGLVLTAKVGATELWTVRNATDYDHPFHLHGFRFQLTEQNGRAPEVRQWKDTVNVPARGQVRFAVHFDDRPGMWMFHCHILDHADLGMMGMLHLE